MNDGRTAPAGADGTDALRVAPLDPDWTLEQAGPPFGSRFSLSNGFLGVARDRTYVAGLFEAPDTDPTVPELVPGPDWSRLYLARDGRAAAVVPDRLQLDMKRGCLWGSGACHGIRFRSLIFVSMAERSLAVQVVWFEAASGSDLLTLDAAPGAPGALLVPDRDAPPHVLAWRTRGDGKALALATDVSVRIDGQAVPATTRDASAPAWSWPAAPGQRATFVRIAAFARSALGTADAGAEGKRRSGGPPPPAGATC